MIRFLLLFLFISLSAFSQKEFHLDSIREIQINKGREAYFNKDVSALTQATEKLLLLSKKFNDSSSLSKFYHYKALAFRLKYLNDSAYYYYYLSKGISESNYDSLQAARRLLSMAVLQRNAQDYIGSEISSIEALKYFENLKIDRFIQITYNNLGLVSEELNRKEEALEYYKKASEIGLVKDNNKEYLYIINNTGLLYQKEDEHIKAIEYFKRGLAIDSLKMKYPTNYALLLENLAFSNYSLGKKQNVLKQYQEVLAIRKKEKDIKELSTTHINISNYYKDNGNKEKALSHANKALQYAKQTHYNKRWLESLESLSELSEGTKATNYFKRYIKLNDSLIQYERGLKNQFAKIRYETDKKEKENTVLKSENEKKQAEISYQKQQKTIGWLLAGSTLLILLLSIMSFVLRRKKLIYEAQLQKAEVREKERQQIAKSLHDEVAGDLRLLHQKLEKSQLIEEAKKLESVKDNVRDLSHKLSSVSFEKVSFKDQVINLVSDYFSLDFKINVTGLQEYDWSTINTSIKRLLYLSIRESIQNSQKYAEASQININFLVRKKSVFLNVTDNGVGFDTTTIKKGIGLLNLEERVEELNGTLVIESELGKGTQTKIKLPLNVQKTKILLVDDHQLIIEGIIAALKDIDGLEIETANTCDDAYTKIKSSLPTNPFQIVFTDLSFDNAQNNSILDSGEALIKKLQQENIAIKMAVITGHSETNRVFNVIHNLNPSAYILKSKCNTAELNFAIEKMLVDEVYYTHEIHQKLLKRALVEIQMDETAIQILKELPKHTKISNMEGIITKSDGSLLKIRSIENKLSKLRTDLQAVNNTDLVLKAKELGILD